MRPPPPPPAEVPAPSPPFASRFPPPVIVAQSSLISAPGAAALRARSCRCRRAVCTKRSSRRERARSGHRSTTGRRRRRRDQRPVGGSRRNPHARDSRECRRWRSASRRCPSPPCEPAGTTGASGSQRRHAASGCEALARVTEGCARAHAAAAVEPAFRRRRRRRCWSASTSTPAPARRPARQRAAALSRELAPSTVTVVASRLRGIDGRDTSRRPSRRAHGDPGGTSSARTGIGVVSVENAVSVVDDGVAVRLRVVLEVNRPGRAALVTATPAPGLDVVRAQGQRVVVHGDPAPRRQPHRSPGFHREGRCSPGLTPSIPTSCRRASGSSRPIPCRRKWRRSRSRTHGCRLTIALPATIRIRPPPSVPKPPSPPPEPRCLGSSRTP